MFRKEQMDRELDAEFASHLELHIADNLRSGMTPEAARRDALLKLGGVEQTKEAVRDHRGISFLEAFLQIFVTPCVTCEESSSFFCRYFRACIGYRRDDSDVQRCLQCFP